MRNRKRHIAVRELPLANESVNYWIYRLQPPLGGIPSDFLDETYTVKTRGMGLLYGEMCMILTSTVFDWSTRVTDRRMDRRTDGRTDGFAIAYSALSMLSRAKNNNFTGPACAQDCGQPSSCYCVRLRPLNLLSVHCRQSAHTPCHQDDENSLVPGDLDTQFAHSFNNYVL